MRQTTGVNRQWLLAAHPSGRALQDTDFRYLESPIPEPAEGEVLVRNCFFGFDPAQKGWMEGAMRYVAPINIGDVVRGSSLGYVVASKSKRFSPGDRVVAMGGWQDYAVLEGSPAPLALEKLSHDRPATAALSILGATGLTAYFGLFEIGTPRPGDTVVVSGAAGATGSTVGQLAKLAGCRAIGIAGGSEKRNWLVADLRLDAAIDYKVENVADRLQELCPDGIDVFYDNVGGGLLNDALRLLALNARVVICGAISRYESGQVAQAGPGEYFNLVYKRARMEGFLLMDFAARFDAARRRLWHWVEAGRLCYREDIQQGFENAPRTLMRLFQGRNIGKQLLQIAALP